MLFCIFDLTMNCLLCYNMIEHIIEASMGIIIKGKTDDFEEERRKNI